MTLGGEDRAARIGGRGDGAACGPGFEIVDGIDDAPAEFAVGRAGAIGAVLYERKIKWFMQGLTHWSTQTLIWVLFILAGWWPYFLPAVIREESIAVMSLIMIVGQVHGKFIINLEIVFWSKDLSLILISSNDFLIS